MPAVPEAPAPAYVVTAKLAIFKTMTPDGIRMRYFYEGAPVPADAPPEQIEHHLAMGMIAKTGDAGKTPARKPAGG
jgi:hypothetical protein